MYEIIKRVIMSGRFVVNDITNKIDVLWAESRLTDEERDELLDMMVEHLNPSTEAPGTIERINNLEARVKSLEKAVEALRGVAQIESSELPETEEPSEVIVPEWTAWDGISSNYQYGDVVIHNSKYFLNVLQGVQNVWEPGSAGVDERYWKEITKEQAEGIISGSTTVEEVLGIEQPEEEQELKENESL